MPRIRTAAIIAAFAAVGVARAAAQPSDSAMIAIAKRASVRTLDSTLTAMPFAQWLTTLRSLPASRVSWGVNDCGEGGDGREAPFCVEAKLELGGDTTASAYIIVAGSDRKVGAPGVFMLVAMVGKTTRFFKTLAEWAAFVRPRDRSDQARATMRVSED